MRLHSMRGQQQPGPPVNHNVNQPQEENQGLGLNDDGDDNDDDDEHGFDDPFFDLSDHEWADEQNQRAQDMPPRKIGEKIVTHPHINGK